MTYLDELGAINEQAIEARPVTEEEVFRDWPEPVDFRAGALAVAAKVLRDVRRVALDNRKYPSHPHYRVHEVIYAFDAEHGIALETDR